MNGILELETDLASDTFRVAYDPRRTGVNAMLTAISEVGYQGREVPAAAFGEPVRWRINDLPAELQELFAQAKSDHRLVLIDVHGPG